MCEILCLIIINWQIACSCVGTPLHFLCQSSSSSRLQFPSFKGSDRNPHHQRPPRSSVDNVKDSTSMTLGLRADDCNDVPSMENWLNAGADWTEHHGINIAATASADELFYDQVTHPDSTSSFFGPPTRQQALTTHPFLKLDTLELCKESIPLVRTGSSSMVDSSSNEDEISTEHVANSTVVSVSTSLLDRAPAEVNLDSPRGPLSPSALQLGKSPTGTKRPFDDLATQAYSPFPAAMANSTFLPSGSASVVAPQGIIFPTPLTLPNVPSMEEIAQSRPKRRNVKISTDPQSVAARHRRERISDRVRVLQHFVPGGTKMDTASMLDEAIHYVKFLQQQLQAFERIGNGYDPRFLTQGGPVMMPQVNSSSSSPARPFDLNCAVYQAFPCTSMMQSQQQPQNVTTWPTFCSQGFPDSSQEQFCH